MNTLLEQVVGIARAAGEEILEVYNHSDFDVEVKGDGSPLTEADRRAHQLIESSLVKLTPDIPVLSEESAAEAFAARHSWSRFWLVDPLDGTKEFVKRNGEFTVNIALIDNTRPTIGVVHTPVRKVSHYAEIGVGAFKQDQDQTAQRITTRKMEPGRVVMVASRSHGGDAVQAYRSNLQQQLGDVEITSMGSSLKLCLVAEGAADIYPRLGPTSEWDTAAAHCLVDAAGGGVVQLDGTSLVYNKQNILNPWFLVYGDGGYDWTLAAQGIDSKD